MCSSTIAALNSCYLDDPAKFFSAVGIAIAMGAIIGLMVAMARKGING